MDIALDHFLQQNNLRLFRIRYNHNTGQYAWHLHGGKFQFPIPVFLRYKCSKIQ